VPSLHEVQRALAAVLSDGDASAVASLVHSGSLPAAERVAIYGNNSWMAFRNSLELSFPVVARLGGCDWFGSVARRYRAAHPSRNGNLQYVGQEFPGFLATELAGGRHEVIADVAALEWAYQEVLVAPEAPPFDTDALAAVPSTRYPELVFPLAPHCRLVASPWPILAVWQANRDAARQVHTIDLDAGGDRLLLRRERLEVALHRMDAGDWTFLDALAAGLSLGAATGRALAVAGGFDLVAALGRFVGLGAFAGAFLPTGHVSKEMRQ
jgi:hypothetical protein